ncbi:hypothetical protein KY343_00545 [Candidatus Woesearchaeota archaeon]|nr:hypothetical protein [Candidatus Woesearchaeota archaeon]
MKKKGESKRLFLSLFIAIILCVGMISFSYASSAGSAGGSDSFISVMWDGIVSFFKYVFGGITGFAIGGDNGYYYYGGCPVCSITVIKYNDLDGDGMKDNNENNIQNDPFAIVASTDIAIEDDKLQLTDNTGKTVFEYDCPLAPGKDVFISEDLTIGAAPHPGWVNTGIGPDNPVTCLCPDDCEHTVYVGNRQIIDVPNGTSLDFGDAPESAVTTNHFGLNMTAYPKGGPLGVLARFPTVFDPYIKNNYGPCHLRNISADYPKLGTNITNDWNDADVMPDDDNVPNINVTADLPDLDLADDGLINITGSHCGIGNLTFSVTGTFDKTYYFSAWVDFNRDGDWEDTITDCNGQSIPEQIVKDMEINAPGIYSNTSWIALNALPNDEKWIRLSLYHETDIFGEPVGTPITNCTDLQAMQNDLGGDYYLANDIDCYDTINWNIDDNCSDYTTSTDCYASGRCGWVYEPTPHCIDNNGFEPIGPDHYHRFYGTLDGRGHTITGLYINNAYSVALFEYVHTGAVIKNLGLVDVDINGGSGASALVVRNHGGEINKCYSTGNVELFNQGYGAGGLVSFMYSGKIIDSYSTATIISSDYYGGSNAGGLVGSVSYGVQIDRCYATGDVTATGGRVGGLVGDLGGTITDSFSTGIVSGVENSSSGYGVGGLVGSASLSSSITSSYWYNFTGNPSKCVGYGSNAGCTAIDTESYFYSSSNAPMTNWNFIDNWQENTNDYPTLRFTGPTKGMNEDGSMTKDECFTYGETEDYYSVITVPPPPEYDRCPDSIIPEINVPVDHYLTSWDNVEQKPIATCEGATETCPNELWLNPNHFAVTRETYNPIYFQTNIGSSKDPIIVNSMYTLNDTYGCTCEQILECKHGNNKGEYKWGCSPGTINVWIKQEAEWARNCEVYPPIVTS